MTVVLHKGCHAKFKVTGGNLQQGEKPLSVESLYKIQHAQHVYSLKAFGRWLCIGRITMRMRMAVFRMRMRITAHRMRTRISVVAWLSITQERRFYINNLHFQIIKRIVEKRYKTTYVPTLDDEFIVSVYRRLSHSNSKHICDVWKTETYMRAGSIVG